MATSWMGPMWFDKKDVPPCLGGKITFGFPHYQNKVNHMHSDLVKSLIKSNDCDSAVVSRLVCLGLAFLR